MLTVADQSAVSALESATSAAVTAFFAIPEDARPDACAFVGQHLLANAQQHAVDRPRPPSARAPYRPTSARGAAHGPGHAAPRAAPPAAPRHGADFRRGRYVQPVSARVHNTRLYAR